MKRIPLPVQILAAVVLAIVCGSLTGTARVGTVPVVEVYSFLGELFLNALKMVVVPLVVASIVTGIAGVGARTGFGRMGLKTLAYYVTTTLLAILVGLILVNTIQPGGGGASAGIVSTTSSEEVQAQLARTEGRGMEDLPDVFLRLIPPNVIAAATEGNMLGLIFFSLLFGYFLSRLPQEKRQFLSGVFQGLYEVMLKITDFVMCFAPIGVFALVANVFANTGLEAFKPVALFFVTVLLALATHMFVTLPLLLRFVGKIRPYRQHRAMLPALLTAFSTASSSATLPLTLECVERRAGVSNRTASFVLPLGATVNMDGTALYECVAAMFIAQAYGVELSFAAQFTVVLLALLTSIGVAGIPAASLVAIVIVMHAVGLPPEGIGLIMAVDRLLDMCRTAVNIFSDSCGAVIIARSEGETGILEEPTAEA